MILKIFKNFENFQKKLNFRRGCERVAVPPGRLQKIPQNRPKFTYIKYVKDEIENSKNISIKKNIFQKLFIFILIIFSKWFLKFQKILIFF